MTVIAYMGTQTTRPPRPPLYWYLCKCTGAQIKEWNEEVMHVHLYHDQMLVFEHDKRRYLPNKEIISAQF